MPKKRRNPRRFYNSKVLGNKPTNQQTTKTYWRWFAYDQSFQKPTYLLNLQLPGYFTHKFEPAYKLRRAEKKKY
jgi:hypothetical protein